MWKGLRNNDSESDWRESWRCWCSGIVGLCGGIAGWSSRFHLLICGLSSIDIGGWCVLIIIRASG